MTEQQDRIGDPRFDNLDTRPMFKRATWKALKFDAATVPELRDLFGVQLAGDDTLDDHAGFVGDTLATHFEHPERSIDETKLDLQHRPKPDSEIALRRVPITPWQYDVTFNAIAGRIKEGEPDQEISGPDLLSEFVARVGHKLPVFRRAILGGDYPMTDLG